MSARRVIGVAASFVAMGIASVGLTACQPPIPDRYVALGDSYTAGPLIPNQSTDPLGCLRSDHNYPSIVKTRIKVTKFRDNSCSGATTTDLYNVQNVTPGPNQPQLDLVDSETKVVTMGMGGNDIGFTDIVKTCALQNPFGSGCKSSFVHGTDDTLIDRINATAPKIDFALASIRGKSKLAKIFVIGYPTILPATGTGCYPKVPILPGDVVYLRGIEQALNAMLKARAIAAHDYFVDTATSSIGHDACASANWVEGIIPTHVAAPVHPNASGMMNTGLVVAAAINAVVKT